MRLCAIATTLLLTASPQALAAATDTLAEALDRLPAMILTNPAAEHAYFLDVTVQQRLVAEAAPANAYEAMLRMEAAGMLHPVAAIHQGGIAPWEEKGGIALSQVRYFTGFGDYPYIVNIWGLESAETAQGVLDMLAARDFAPVGGDAVLGNGEPMKSDVAARDPSNPWRGQIGQATFVAGRDETLIQANVPEAVEAALRMPRDAARNPVVATTLAGLDAALGEGSIVQGMLISPAFGLGAVDPAGFLLPGPGNMDEIRAQFEARMAEAQKGIPPYLGGFVADVQRDRPGAAFALTFGDCATAETAAGLIEARWTQSMAEKAPGTLESVVTEGVDGLCAAVVTVTAAESGLRNPVFEQVMNAYYQRQFTVLQIGETP